MSIRDPQLLSLRMNGDDSREGAEHIFIKGRKDIVKESYRFVDTSFQRRPTFGSSRYQYGTAVMRADASTNETKIRQSRHGPRSGSTRHLLYL